MYGKKKKEIFNNFNLRILKRQKLPQIRLPCYSIFKDMLFLNIIFLIFFENFVYKAKWHWVLGKNKKKKKKYKINKIANFEKTKTTIN